MVSSNIESEILAKIKSFGKQQERSEQNLVKDD